MHLAVAEMQRRHEIIGDAFGAQLVQDAVVHHAIRIGEPAAERLAGFADMHHRAVDEGIAFEQIEASVGHHRASVRMPDETAPNDLRMQRAHEHHHPPQRQSSRGQPLAQFGQHFLRQRSVARAVDEPLNDGLD